MDFLPFSLQTRNGSIGKPVQNGDAFRHLWCLDSGFLKHVLLARSYYSHGVVSVGRESASDSCLPGVVGEFVLVASLL